MDFLTLAFVTVVVLAIAMALVGIIYGISLVVTAYRRHVWALAARLAEERGDEIPPAGLDIIELDQWRHRVREVPPIQRVLEMSRDELIDGLLAHRGEGIRMAVELAAVRAERAAALELAARKERARARHWATIKRMRAA